MAKAVARRNVGREILEGLRELKRGEVGRVVSIPPVAAVRERTGLSQVKFWSCPGSVDGLALGSQASSVVISRVLWVGSRAA